MIKYRSMGVTGRGDFERFEGFDAEGRHRLGYWCRKCGWEIKWLPPRSDRDDLLGAWLDHRHPALPAGYRPMRRPVRPTN